VSAARAVARSPAWIAVCALEDVLPDSGVAALVAEREVAIFRVGDAVYAIGNYDPASGVSVLGRGIVGDIGRDVVVASPIYKQHYSLLTGRCLEDDNLSVPAYLARVIDGTIWVRQEPLAARGVPRKRRLVVVGNGMAAMRAIEELLELEPQAYHVEVFGAEPHGGYNRVLLSSLLAGDKRLEDVVTHSLDWFSERSIVMHCADPVVHIDRRQRRVRSQKGIEVSYDRLLIATGSRPVFLAVPGRELPGVLAFRDLHDVDAMLKASREHRRAVVIGGGLLGLEAANGLRARGMEVTVIHLCSHLMERQLDRHAAELLRGELERRGIEFRLGASTSQFLGTTELSGVRLADGSDLAADLAVVAVGIKPNIGLALAAGLPCDRGILVDDTLQTNDPAIYAVGECVQHRGKTFGLVAPLFEQARVCATFLAQRSVRGYRDRTCSTRLKVAGIDVFSAGDLTPATGTESLVLRDPKRGVYKRLLVHDDKIRGAVLYGDVRDAQYYLDLIEQNCDIRPLREHLLFGEPTAVAV
jgi:NAD(P)H-dependent nitrite reductase small subunit